MPTPPAVTPGTADSGTVAPRAGPGVIDTALIDTSLLDTARALVADDKGVPAIDESIPTCNRRVTRLGIDQTEPARRASRELIVTTSRLGDSISGVIVCDETIRQHTADGVPFLSNLREAGIATSIKADLGATLMAGHPGKKVTEGLDGLRARLAEYRQLDAGFAKWRAVLTIGAATPNRACTRANAHTRALRRALLGSRPGAGRRTGSPDDQRAHPVAVRPGHRRCASRRAQPTTGAGSRAGGHTPETQYDPSRAWSSGPGPGAGRGRSHPDVPAAVAEMAFLSGGQSGDLATTRLAAINNGTSSPLPWPVAFSFGRSIQQRALTIWDGQDRNVARARQALQRRATSNRDTRLGEYNPSASTAHA